MSYSEPLINQLRVFFLSIGVGFILCAFYVALNGFFHLFGKSRWVIYTSDIIFSIFITLFSFFFMVFYNNGRVRMHLFVGEAIGFFSLYLSLGRYLLKSLCRFFDFISGIIKLILKPYVIILTSLKILTKKIFLWLKGKKSVLFKRKRKSNGEDEKKMKKFNFIGKIHLKNSDKSV